MIRALLRVALVVCFATTLSAYSVLTHEAIIDSAWDGSIKPLLLARFPDTTPKDLIKAHAYAYGGCILQDMGYYPFGSKFFSDLLHYVRTGEFVTNQIRESQDVFEYAFALGSLAHYAADTQGHPVAVNRSVALQYPKLGRKFGKVVTYEDDPTAHIRVEFSFDVLQVARGNYAPQAYHDFIGFEVAKPVLERAFRDTYCMELKDVFSDLDLALSTFRFSVSAVIPEMTRVAWKLDKNDLMSARPDLTRRAFIYNLSRASYRKEWDGKYQHPGVGTTVLAFFIRILPKIGPLKALSFKPPTPQTDRLFEDSFDRTMGEYRTLLSRQKQSQLVLANVDFDTGKPTSPTEYRMADDAYAKLAVKLAEKPAGGVDATLREEVLAYFNNPDLPFASKRKPKEWQETLAALDKLKAQKAASTAGPE
jgi:hypothetical protein